VGAHVLFELLNDDSVSTVYCLTRKASPLKAVRRSLLERGLLRSPEQTSKVVGLNGSLDRPDFRLDPVGRIFRDMQDSVSLIIHTAWPVNFNLPLADFEPHIQGLYNLIEFSLSVRRLEPAVMMFCSSISAALGISSGTIHEAPLDLDSALMGYGQSKLVGEKMISLARQSGARTYSLRIGQVSGHSEKGLWNDSEVIPLMIRSALTLRALPELRQDCSWLPVDKLASVVLELAESCSAPDRDVGPNRASAPSGVAYVDDSIYHVYNSRVFPWSELLATLRRNGFQFQTLAFEEWLQLLRESEARGEENINPAVKLIHHYELIHGVGSPIRQNGTRVFVADKAERDSVTLRNGRLNIVEDGILDCYARDWSMRWANF
jgi:thioester reductase-like protein